ncbi:acyltransferase [Enterobacteriaceae bacterium H16N7]|nr:acyltransferase [Dryocola clanedunensis]
MKNELQCLQIVRGVAAMMVVTNHILGSAFPHLWGSFFRSNGGFGVDLFFVLSGFLMVYTQHEGKGPIDFLIGRVSRIYPLYIIVSTPLILMYIKFDDFYAMIGNFLLLPSFNMPDYKMANAPTWTLVYEMVFYYIFTISLIFSRKKITSCILSVSAIVLILIATRHLGQQPRMEGVNAGYMLGDTLMLNFAAGCLLALAHEKLKSRTLIPFPMFVITTAFVFYIVFNQYIIAERIFLFGIPAIIVIAMASITAPSNGFIFKLLHKIGDASYSIYLCHIFLAHAYQQAMITNKYQAPYCQVLALIFVILSVVVGIFANHHIEKPVNNWLKMKIKARQSKRADLALTGSR